MADRIVLNTISYHGHGPNTPAMVGAGMTAACANALVTKEELEKVLTILRSFGEVEVVSEHLIDAVVSASGSSPAYVFMMIEAMADAAVQMECQDLRLISLPLRQ